MLFLPNALPVTTINNAQKMQRKKECDWFIEILVVFQRAVALLGKSAIESGRTQRLEKRSLKTARSERVSDFFHVAVKMKQFATRLYKSKAEGPPGVARFATSERATNGRNRVIDR